MALLRLKLGGFPFAFLFALDHRALLIGQRRELDERNAEPHPPTGGAAVRRHIGLQTVSHGVLPISFGCRVAAIFACASCCNR